MVQAVNFMLCPFHPILKNAQQKWEGVLTSSLPQASFKRFSWCFIKSILCSLLIFIYSKIDIKQKKDLWIKICYNSHLLVYIVCNLKGQLVCHIIQWTKVTCRLGGPGKHHTSYSSLDVREFEQCNVTHVEPFKWGLWEHRANELCERNTGLGSFMTPMPDHAAGEKHPSPVGGSEARLKPKAAKASNEYNTLTREVPNESSETRCMRSRELVLWRWPDLQNPDSATFCL